MLDDKTLYAMADLKYKDTFSNIPEDMLYPFNWYLITDYHLKVLIIYDAIKNNKLIIDTDLYKEKCIEKAN